MKLIIKTIDNGLLKTMEDIDQTVTYFYPDEEIEKMIKHIGQTLRGWAKSEGRYKSKKRKSFSKKTVKSFWKD